ncbi:hypothetical protein ACN38_g5751 [Penicillium nordicum]|uniref:Uncharacterized protein n=1 Tax=Penicillium nordicum TaxID=229535 RepID=A0A0M9WFZ3_9EURO|nr:hypothetical protein ACN38_g5751 [Penicillium nordicum]
MTGEGDVVFLLQGYKVTMDIPGVNRLTNRVGDLAFRVTSRQRTKKKKKKKKKKGKKGGTLGTKDASLKTAIPHIDWLLKVEEIL